MTEPEHRARISPANGRYVARLGDSVIASSTRAVILEKASPRKTYSPVVYFPLEDVDPACLQPSDHSNFCPIKGEAGYYSIVTSGQSLENAVWFYPDPLPMVAGIKGRVAFYEDKVEVTGVTA